MTHCGSRYMAEIAGKSKDQATTELMDALRMTLSRLDMATGDVMLEHKVTVTIEPQVVYGRACLSVRAEADVP